MRKETYKYFVVVYLPCSVIKSQQVLLSSHSHSYWKKETRDVCAQASGLIFMCFNPKMPIHTCARHISTCLTMCTLNQAHLFNPNWRQPKVTTKANYLCQALISSQRAKSDKLLTPQLPRTQPSADPHEMLGLESTGFLPPHHEHWGRVVMDHWEGFLIIFFCLFQPVKWWSIQKWLMFDGFWWKCAASWATCLVLCHAIACQVAALNMWGSVVVASKDREEEEH